jgi:hypothetical protein
MVAVMRVMVMVVVMAAMVVMAVEVLIAVVYVGKAVRVCQHCQWQACCDDGGSDRNSDGSLF